MRLHTSLGPMGERDSGGATLRSQSNWRLRLSSQAVTVPVQMAEVLWEAKTAVAVASPAPRRLWPLCCPRYHSSGVAARHSGLHYPVSRGLLT